MSKVFDLHKIWAYSITSILGFFEPLWVLMLWFFIFIACDFITGISASIKERQVITSNKLSRTIKKMLMYCMVIVLVHAIDKDMLVFIDLSLARICATIICGIELYSILENCYRLTGNQVFKILTQFTLKKIEDNTGVNVIERK
ncbi:MAG: phage holin family protein [Methanobrevibacter sp.]|nr:phage holin family protein [Methanobrevibacter sp.]